MHVACEVERLERGARGGGNEREVRETRARSRRRACASPQHRLSAVVCTPCCACGLLTKSSAPRSAIAGVLSRGAAVGGRAAATAEAPNLPKYAPLVGSNIERCGSRKEATYSTPSGPMASPSGQSRFSSEPIRLRSSPFEALTRSTISLVKDATYLHRCARNCRPQRRNPQCRPEPSSGRARRPTRARMREERRGSHKAPP